MNEALTVYFDGEKGAGLVLAAMGAVMLVAGLAFFPARYELRAFAITLLAWSALELAVGVGLYLKTGPQVVALRAQLGGDATAFFAAELPRMEKVQRNFVVIEAVWLGLTLASAAVAFAFKARLTPSNVALACAVNAACFLAFDIVAERRGALYEAALRAGATNVPGR